MKENRDCVVLSCEDLSYERMGMPVFCGLGLSLMSGGVIAVIGRNGAGKTTLLRCLAGLLPVRGAIRHPERFLYLGHRDAVKEEVTVEENLRFWAKIDGEPMLLEAAVEYWGLRPYLEMPCAQLSAGWKKRVALARLLTNPAPLWLLDEPYAHLDAHAVRLLGALIESRARGNGAVVLATHHLPPGALGQMQHPGALHIEDFAWKEAASVLDAA